MIDHTLFERVRENDVTLTALDFSYQELTLDDLVKLAKALEKNAHIKSLNIAGNGLGDAAALILERVSTLTSLNLGGNQLTPGGAKILSANPFLTELDVSYNHLGSKGAEYLARNHRLIKLIMIDNQVGSECLESFLENTYLMYLDLTGNEIGPEGAAVLARHTSLTYLGLSDNHITDQGAATLALNQNLTSLDVSSNGISASGVKALAANITLRQLNLDYNRFEIEGILQLARNTTLVSLSLIGDCIDNKGMIALGNNGTLRELNLSFNQISDWGLEGVLDVADHSNLHRLSLGFNQIGTKGACALAKYHNLAWLDLSYNLILDAGAVALSQSNSLTYLDLIANHIEFEGADALSQNSVLRTLKLDSNFVGDVGAIVLAGNPTIESLGLRYNEIGNPGAMVLARSKTLKTLWVGFNPIGSQGKQALLSKPGLLHPDDLTPIAFSEIIPYYKNFTFLLTPNFICACNMDGLIAFFNPNFARVLNYSANELLGRPFYNLLHPDDRKIGVAAMLVSSKVPDTEIRCLSKRGFSLTFRWNCQVKGNYVFIVGADITEQKKHDLVLLSKAQEHQVTMRIRESSEFISRLCHEIRNPLTGVYGLANILQDKLRQLRETLTTGVRDVVPSNIAESLLRLSEIDQALSEIFTCLMYQRNILDDNLDLCKFEEKKLTCRKKPLKLNVVMREVFSMLHESATQKGLAATLDLPPEDIYVYGDVIRIKQIAVNLIVNAIKFTEHGSVVVTLSVANETASSITSEIAVRDTGIGLSQEEITNLFQRFYSVSRPTASAGGIVSSGLGLYLSENVAKMMGGKIFVTSEKGKGSTFSCVIPLDKMSPEDIVQYIRAQEVAELLPSLPFTPNKYTVLAVEDDVLILRILKRFLEQAGYKVLAAANGEVAVRCYEDSEHKIDIILMDMIMPVMCGLDAMRIIRHREKEKGRTRVPIIVLSGQALEEERQSALVVGADAFLSKPFDKQELYQIIQSLLLQGEVARKAQEHQVELPPSQVEPPPSMVSLPHSTMFHPARAPAVYVAQCAAEPQAEVGVAAAAAAAAATAALPVIATSRVVMEVAQQDAPAERKQSESKKSKSKRKKAAQITTKAPGHH